MQPSTRCTTTQNIDLIKAKFFYKLTIEKLQDEKAGKIIYIFLINLIVMIKNTLTLTDWSIVRDLFIFKCLTVNDPVILVQ